MKTRTVTVACLECREPVTIAAIEDEPAAICRSCAETPTAQTRPEDRDETPDKRRHKT